MTIDNLRVGFIVGPTGIGKSALAIQVAERLDAEIVNADSRLLYRGMDIGTAKPTAEDRQRVRHHLIDIRWPSEPVDVAQFRGMAADAIAEISSRGKRVIVTGGSGLYVKVLRRGIFPGPAASRQVRDKLHHLASERGVEHLHEKLRAVDPETASRLSHHDLYRIVRALEVYELTGVPISVHQNRHRFAEVTFASMTIGLSLPREQLYTAINQRVESMIGAGLVDEVRSLAASGYRPDVPPLSTIGYKHVAAHLGGELSLEAAVSMAKRDTRRLAKRQLTWLRRDPEIIWLETEDSADRACAIFQHFFSADEVKES